MEKSPQEKFFNDLAAGFAECVEISKKKNADYAGSGDPFKNFRAAELLGMTLEQGIILRMSDKLVRIGNLLTHEAKVEDEKIDDTLKDLANYAMILRVYLKNKKV